LQRDLLFAYNSARHGHDREHAESAHGEFFKYPCVLSDRAFRAAFGWEPAVALGSTLRSAVQKTRSP
jgi:hypothetical protein